MAAGKGLAGHDQLEHAPATGGVAQHEIAGYQLGTVAGQSLGRGGAGGLHRGQDLGLDRVQHDVIPATATRVEAQAGILGLGRNDDGVLMPLAIGDQRHAHASARREAGTVEQFTPRVAIGAQTQGQASRSRAQIHGNGRALNPGILLAIAGEGKPLGSGLQTGHAGIALPTMDSLREIEEHGVPGASQHRRDHPHEIQTAQQHDAFPLNCAVEGRTAMTLRDAHSNDSMLV